MATTRNTVPKKAAPAKKAAGVARATPAAQGAGSVTPTYLVRGDLVTDKVGNVDKLFVSVCGQKISVEQLAACGAEHLTLRIKLSKDEITRYGTEPILRTSAALQAFLDTRADHVISAEVTCCVQE